MVLGELSDEEFSALVAYFVYATSLPSSVAGISGRSASGCALLLGDGEDDDRTVGMVGDGGVAVPGIFQALVSAVPESLRWLCCRKGVGRAGSGRHRRSGRGESRWDGRRLRGARRPRRAAAEAEAEAEMGIGTNDTTTRRRRRRMTSFDGAVEVVEPAAVAAVAAAVEDRSRMRWWRAAAAVPAAREDDNGGFRSFGDDGGDVHEMVIAPLTAEKLRFGRAEDGGGGMAEWRRFSARRPIRCGRRRLFR